MGLSKRAFAAIVGVSDTAVRKAVKSGRLSMLSDGTIDQEAGLVEWAKATDPARSRLRTGPNGSHPTGSQAKVDRDDVSRMLREGTDREGTSVDFGTARTIESILKSQERELKLAQRRKELVPIGAVRAHVERAFIGLRQAIQRLPSRHVSSIAAEIGCDPSRLDAALSKAIAAELDVLSSPVVRA